MPINSELLGSQTDGSQLRNNAAIYVRSSPLNCLTAILNVGGDSPKLSCALKPPCVLGSGVSPWVILSFYFHICFWLYNRCFLIFPKNMKCKCVRLLSLNQVGRAVLNQIRVQNNFFVPIVVLKEIQLIAFVWKHNSWLLTRGFSLFSFAVMERHVSKYSWTNIKWWKRVKWS